MREGVTTVSSAAGIATKMQVEKSSSLGWIKWRPAGHEQGSQEAEAVQ